MSDLAEVRRRAMVSTYYDWAVNPRMAADVHRHVIGKEPEPVTKETVRKNLGDEAAEAWIDLLRAKAFFFKAAGVTS